MIYFVCCNWKINIEDLEAMRVIFNKNIYIEFEITFIGYTQGQKIRKQTNCSWSNCPPRYKQYIIGSDSGCSIYRQLSV